MPSPDPPALDVDRILLWYFSLLAGLTAVFFPEIPRAGALLALYLACALLAALLPSFSRGLARSRALLLRVVLLCLLVPVAFSSLGFMIQHVSPDERHWQLLVWDRRLFGGDPVRDVHRLGQPWLTDLLSVGYASFYFLPLALGIALYRRRQLDDLDRHLAAVALGFFLSYLGYLLVPARSPNDFLPGLWQEGWLVGEPLARAIRETELLKRDAFPSGHFEVALLTLLLAWRMLRPFFWILLPFGAGLSIATFYLGYHFLVDLAAGGLLGLLVFWTVSDLPGQGRGLDERR